MHPFGIEVAPDERRELESILRRQYVVRDEQDFITSFDPRDGDTLDAAVADLVEHFHDPDGDGYDGTDMVVWRGGRIVAIVRRGDDGAPDVTLFTSELSGS
jgi:hypothetical protein